MGSWWPEASSTRHHHLRSVTEAAALSTELGLVCKPIDIADLLLLVIRALGGALATGGQVRLTATGARAALATDVGDIVAAGILAPLREVNLLKTLEFVGWWRQRETVA